MQFLYPSFLFALSALAIPIIIHLFNFRRYKKIFFTNVRFLMDLEQEQKSSNKLRHLLLFILRLLAIAAIVFAFAHPFIPKKNALHGGLNPGKKYVSLYIDNSFSMGNTGADGELLQSAKKYAGEIASGYKEGDGYNLVTNDFEIKHQRWVNRTEFLRMVSDINLSPAFRKVSDIANRMKENFRKVDAGNHEAYLISDFQQNMADFGDLKKDSSAHFSFVPVQASAHDNIYIDSVWFESPIWQMNQKNTLNVKIVNSGDHAISDHTLNFDINGKAKALANFSIPEQSSMVVPLNYTISDSGINNGIVSIDDYPITFDDKYYLNYNVTNSIPILVINGIDSNKNISSAFGAERSFLVHNVLTGNVDYSSLDRYNFIILNELPEISSGLAASLKTYMEKNGNVLVIPSSKDINTESYSSFFTLCAADGFIGDKTDSVGFAPLDKQEPFFANIIEDMPRNVSMPKANKYFQEQKTANGRARALLSLSNGDPVLSMVPQGKGYLFVSAVPFNDTWTNFAHHWLFLPSLYKMAFYHTREQPIAYTIDKDNLISITSISGDEKRIFSLAKDSIEFIPNQRMLEGSLQLFVEGLIHTAGYYHLKDNQPGNATALKPYQFAFNYDRSESIMKFTNPGDIKDAILDIRGDVLNPGKVSLKKQVKELEAGINIWKWFIWAALVFLLGEMLVTRFWK